MIINLRYQSKDYWSIIKPIRIKKGTDISDILSNISAECLAEWDIVHEGIIGDYRNSGILEADKVYNISSRNPKKNLEYLSRGIGSKLKP